MADTDLDPARTDADDERAGHPRRADDDVDQASEESFPASDPPSYGSAEPAETGGGTNA
jgi:hypothetical protein